MEKNNEKEVTIIVNGREKTVEKNAELSFSDIVALAFDNTPGENTMFTVTYRKGQGNKPEGTLVDGDTVKVKDGMIFNVTATDKS
jgi:outer membrane protein assembly factor BamB